MTGDDYLWDRSGVPDAQVRELEARLSVLRHRGDAPPAAAPRPTRRPAPARAPLVAVAAAALLGWWLWPSGPPAELRLDVGGRAVAWPDRIEASAGDVRVRLGRVGDLTLRRGATMRVERLDTEQARLFLERGALEAFVAPTVQERWLEVGTPAARCVDLGCRYRLEVDDGGVATVFVELGRVAFADGRGEVVVPFGAMCRATPEGGAGTPRYLADRDTPFAGVLDRLDDAGEAPVGSMRRLDLTRKLLSMSGADHRTLSLWHLLQDRDRRVAETVAEWLVQHYGRPPALDAAVSAAAPEAWSPWRRFLQPLWWPP